ncbi:MAG: hypothetical protein ACREIV_10725, partial [Planctomycetaceae bacterium]
DSALDELTRVIVWTGLAVLAGAAIGAVLKTMAGPVWATMMLTANVWIFTVALRHVTFPDAQPPKTRTARIGETALFLALSLASALVLLRSLEAHAPEIQGAVLATLLAIRRADATAGKLAAGVVGFGSTLLVVSLDLL